MYVDIYNVMNVTMTGAGRDQGGAEGECAPGHHSL
jgi:hypothetical protein